MIQKGGVARMDNLVFIPENPAPELVEAIWYKDGDGRKLRVMFAPVSSKFNPGRGTIILCPGRTEYIEKYFEVIRDMQARGFAVVCFDWPGQGLSDRLVSDPLVGHIDNFNTYVGALRAGLNAVGDRAIGPHVLLAHSMGGAIGLEAMRQHAIEVEAAAFSAPMWGLKTPPLAGFIAKVMFAIGSAGKSLSKTSEQGVEAFENNPVTNDETRHAVNNLLIAAQGKLALGPVSWGWVAAALKVTKGFLRPGVLDHIKTPILVASAEEELLVDNASHAELAGRMKGAQHIVVKGAKHEILMETDKRRAAFYSAFDKLLDRANI